MVTSEKAVHECEYVSICCGKGSAEYTELDYGTDGNVVGFCGACHEGTGFECNLCRCPECDEIVRDENGDIDARVLAGMKCGRCAYG